MEDFMEILNLSWEEDEGSAGRDGRGEALERKNSRGLEGGLGLLMWSWRFHCVCSHIPGCLCGALTQRPALQNVLARRQLIRFSSNPVGWEAAILQREALGVQCPPAPRCTLCPGPRWPVLVVPYLSAGPLPSFRPPGCVLCGAKRGLALTTGFTTRHPRSGQPHAHPSIQQPRDLAAFLQDPCCLQDPVQDLRLPHEAPGTLCPICFL